MAAYYVVLTPLPEVVGAIYLDNYLANYFCQRL